MTDCKVIIWDFDGVIIFSNEVREEGFLSIFKEYDNQLVDELIQFHRINGGLSRYVKIRYFFEELLGKPVDEEKVIVLAQQFSEVMKSKLGDKRLLNPDWLSFMQKSGAKYIHHIASGSDGEELKGLCDSLAIAEHFGSINGSPTPKNQLVADILKENRYHVNDVVLIGDAINDFDAAKINGISFRGYNNTELKSKGEYILKLNSSAL